MLAVTIFGKELTWRRGKIMEHPFLNREDLNSKSIEELQDAISSLNSKLTFAHRTGNGPLIHQLQMVLESYRNQVSKKMDELFEKQKINTRINIQSENEQLKN